MNFSIAIIGGSSFDTEIKTLFNTYNLDVIHHDARKSSDLKRQRISKNTIGVIITVNRSHQVFGNSNEIVRNLVEDDTPFVFSGSNLASLNSAKLLLGKISEKFPEVVKKKHYISTSAQKLDFYKTAWTKNDDSFFKLMNEFFNQIDLWDKNLTIWKNQLSYWKEVLIKWKETSVNKNLRKKNPIKYNFLATWKEELHLGGIEIEKYINIATSWKVQVETDFNNLVIKHTELEKKIKTMEKIVTREEKSNLNAWIDDFEALKEKLPLIANESKEWKDFYLDSFQKIPKWHEECEIWTSAYNRHLEEFFKYK